MRKRHQRLYGTTLISPLMRFWFRWAKSDQSLCTFRGVNLHKISIAQFLKVISITLTHLSKQTGLGSIVLNWITRQHWMGSLVWVEPLDSHALQQWCAKRWFSAPLVAVLIYLLRCRADWWYSYSILCYRVSPADDDKVLSQTRRRGRGGRRTTTYTTITM